MPVGNDVALLVAEEHVARQELEWSEVATLIQLRTACTRQLKNEELRAAAAQRRQEEERARAHRTTTRRIEALEAEEQKKRLDVLQTEELQLDALLRALEKQIQGDVYEAAYEAAQRMKYFNKTLAVIIKNEAAGRRDIQGSERYEFLVLRQHADSAITRQQRHETLTKMQVHKHAMHDEYRRQVLVRKESRYGRRRESADVQQSHHQQSEQRCEELERVHDGEPQEAGSPSGVAQEQPGEQQDVGTAGNATPVAPPPPPRSPTTPAEPRHSERRARLQGVAGRGEHEAQGSASASAQQNSNVRPNPPPEYFARQRDLILERELVLREALEAEERKRWDVLEAKQAKSCATAVNEHLLDTAARGVQQQYFARQKYHLLRDEAVERAAVETMQLASWTGLIRRRNREAMMISRREECDTSRRCAAERTLRQRLERISKQKEAFARRRLHKRQAVTLFTRPELLDEVSGDTATGATPLAASLGIDKSGAASGPMEPVFLPQPPRAMVLPAAAGASARHDGSTSQRTFGRMSKSSSSVAVMRMIGNMQQAQRVTIEKEERLERFAILTQLRNADGHGRESFEEKEKLARQRRLHMFVEQAQRIHKQLKYEEVRFAAALSQRQNANINLGLQKVHRLEAQARCDLGNQQLNTFQKLSQWFKILTKLSAAPQSLVDAEERARSELAATERRLAESIRVSMGFHRPVPPPPPAPPLPPPPLAFDDHQRMWRAHTHHRPRRNAREWEETKPRVCPRRTVVRLQTIAPPNAAHQRAVVDFNNRRPPPPRLQPHQPMSVPLDTGRVGVSPASGRQSAGKDSAPREVRGRPAEAEVDRSSGSEVGHTPRPESEEDAPRSHSADGAHHRNGEGLEMPERAAGQEDSEGNIVVGNSSDRDSTGASMETMSEHSGAEEGVVVTAAEASPASPTQSYTSSSSAGRGRQRSTSSADRNTSRSRSASSDVASTPEHHAGTTRHAGDAGGED